MKDAGACRLATPTFQGGGRHNTLIEASLNQGTKLELVRLERLEAL